MPKHAKLNIMMRPDASSRCEIVRGWERDVAVVTEELLDNMHLCNTDSYASQSTGDILLVPYLRVCMQ